MVVFFDGVCNLCQHSIRYLLKHDKKKILKFATLQGQYAKKLLPPEDLKNLKSIVFYDGKAFYKKSMALLKLCTILGGGHKLLLVGYLLPKLLRDGLYSFIAKNRYRWFGQQEHCMVPTKDLKSTLLD